MKLTIYTGGVPMVAVGENQCNLLTFAEKYQGWHTYKQDRPTKAAVRALQGKGYIEVIGDQFRFQYGSI